MVAEDIVQALQAGRRCLVLSEWREHCRALAAQLGDRGKSPVVLDGSVKKKARRAILSEIREARPEADLLIVATGQYLGEGFDCPQIDTLFLAFPVSFRGKVVQYVGRAMRAYEGKARVCLYDYVDVHVPLLKRMHLRRSKTYRSLGFEQVGNVGTGGLPFLPPTFIRQAEAAKQETDGGPALSSQQAHAGREPIETG